MSEPYVRGWLDDLINHPVIAELKAHPGRWGVLPPYPPDSHEACLQHPNVETRVHTGLRGDALPMARWLPDDLAMVRNIQSGCRDD